MGSIFHTMRGTASWEEEAGIYDFGITIYEQEAWLDAIGVKGRA